MQGSLDRVSYLEEDVPYYFGLVQNMYKMSPTRIKQLLYSRKNSPAESDRSDCDNDYIYKKSPEVIKGKLSAKQDRYARSQFSKDYT